MKTTKTKYLLIGFIIIGGMVLMGIFGMGALAPYREINVEKSFDRENLNEIEIDMTSIPVHVLQTEAGNEI